MQVQAELVRRRVVHVSPTGKKRSFSCNHCFAQMVFCGDCGELYRRVHWNNHGCKSIVWRCISRLEPTSAEKNCTNRTVNELLLQEVTVNAINQILTERGTFLKQLQANIAKAVVNADTLSPDGIQARLEELQKELIKKANNKQDYDAIADEIFPAPRPEGTIRTRQPPPGRTHETDQGAARLHRRAGNRHHRV